MERNTSLLKISSADEIVTFRFPRSVRAAKDGPSKLASVKVWLAISELLGFRMGCRLGTNIVPGCGAGANHTMRVIQIAPHRRGSILIDLPAPATRISSRSFTIGASLTIRCVAVSNGVASG